MIQDLDLNSIFSFIFKFDNKTFDTQKNTNGNRKDLDAYQYFILRCIYKKHYN